MSDAKSPPAYRTKRRCTTCKTGRLEPGTTTVTLERGEAVLVIRNVPALVCDNCGAGYTGGRVTDRVLKIGERALVEGVSFGMHRYTPEDGKAARGA